MKRIEIEETVHYINDYYFNNLSNNFIVIHNKLERKEDFCLHDLTTKEVWSVFVTDSLGVFTNDDIVNELIYLHLTPYALKTKNWIKYISKDKISYSHV